MKFKHRPTVVEAKRFTKVKEIKHPDGKTVIAKPGDWLVDDTWVLSDERFRKVYEPVDEDAQKEWKRVKFFKRRSTED